MELPIIGQAPNHIIPLNARKGPNGNNNATNKPGRSVKLAANHFADNEANSGELPEYLEYCGQPFIFLKTLFTGQAVTEKKIEDFMLSLGDKNKDVRNKAVCDLTDLIESDIPVKLKAKSIKSLIKALKNDNNSELRNGAAFALEYLALSDLSTDPEENRALKEMMVKPLIKALGDEDKSVQEHAKNALENLVESDISIRLKAKIIRSFIKALKSGSEADQELSVNALGYLTHSDIPANLKEIMIDPLIEALNNENWQVRNSAAAVLENLALSDISHVYKEKMIEPLIKTFSNTEELDVIRTHAVLAMENLVTTDSSPDSNISLDSKKYMINPFIKALDDEVPAIHDSANRVLNYYLANFNLPDEVKLKLIHRITPLPKTIDLDMQ